MSEPGPALHFWDDNWDLRPADCPCDVDFVAWLDQTGIRDSAIYHFGTGGHHHVGIECAGEARRNAVLGITAAPAEHEAYVRLAIARPEVLRHYNCVFGDIYLVNDKLLPELDVATLFHLCEFRNEKNDAYGALTDLEVTRRIAGRVRPGGHVLFFPGSFAFDNAKRVIAEWEREGGFEKVGPFRSILVYRRR